MTIGATTKIGVQSNTSLRSNATADTPHINIRHSYTSVSNGTATIKVGHTAAADDEFVSWGAGNAAFYDGLPIIGESMHVDGDSGTAASGVIVAGSRHMFDGPHSSNINYTTSKMGGFTGKVGFASQDNRVAVLTYASDDNGTKVLFSTRWSSRATEPMKPEWVVLSPSLLSVDATSTVTLQQTRACPPPKCGLTVSTIPPDRQRRYRHGPERSGFWR